MISQAGSVCFNSTWKIGSPFSAATFFVPFLPASAFLFHATDRYTLALARITTHLLYIQVLSGAVTNLLAQSMLVTFFEE